jgi:hypothetical protein
MESLSKAVRTDGRRQQQKAREALIKAKWQQPHIEDSDGFHPRLRRFSGSARCFTILGGDLRT